MCGGGGYCWSLFIVKVVPVHTIKAHRGSGGTAPLFLNLGAWRRLAVSINGIQRRYPLNRWLGEPHSQSGRFGEKLKHLSTDGYRTSERPSPSQVAISTVLSRLSPLSTPFRKQNAVPIHRSRLALTPWIPSNQRNCIKVDCVWNVMAHAQKPDCVFRRNGRVHLNRRGRQFSRLLVA
jgi:hypothetical protein